MCWDASFWMGLSYDGWETSTDGLGLEGGNALFGRSRLGWPATFEASARGSRRGAAAARAGRR